MRGISHCMTKQQLPPSTTNQARQGHFRPHSSSANQLQQLKKFNARLKTGSQKRRTSTSRERKTVPPRQTAAVANANHHQTSIGNNEVVNIVSGRNSAALYRQKTEPCASNVWSQARETEISTVQHLETVTNHVASFNLDLNQNDNSAKAQETYIPTEPAHGSHFPRTPQYTVNRQNYSSFVNPSIPIEHLNSVSTNSHSNLN